MTTTPESLGAERAADTLQSEPELAGDHQGHVTNTGMSEAAYLPLRWSATRRDEQAPDGG
jgi:hypothetical protein